LPRDARLFPKNSGDDGSICFTGALHESTSASSSGNGSLIANVDLLNQLIHCAESFKSVIIFEIPSTRHRKNYCIHIGISSTKEVIAYLEQLVNIAR
jgi:hypothetical protein